MADPNFAILDDRKVDFSLLGIRGIGFAFVTRSQAGLARGRKPNGVDQTN